MITRKMSEALAQSPLGFPVLAVVGSRHIIPCLLILIMLVFCGLSAQNHLDVMAILQGEPNTLGMGWGIAALDFNGDSIKDLAVLQGWNPRPEDVGIYEYGRIFFLFGGSGFDTEADFIIYGAPQDYFLPGSIKNAGDVNGDGFEDLTAIRKINAATMDAIYRICVYFGGEQPSPTPGMLFDHPAYWMQGQYVDWSEVFALGDINGDGFDDLGLVTKWNNPDKFKLDIMFGGSYQLYTIYESVTEIATNARINGVGDVNVDGFDDFILTYTHNNDHDNSNVDLYYGCPDISMCEIVNLVSDSSLDYERKPLAAGDVNGDGYADFIGRLIRNGTDYYGALWLGGETLSPVFDVELRPDYFGFGWADIGFTFGDLNGDGKDDLIGSKYTAYADDGAAVIWLGKTHFNGTHDLLLRRPASVAVYSSFGYAMASGDFNADGLDDLAISASHRPPGLSDTPGAIIIYAGNTGLVDTTVAIDDPTQQGDSACLPVVYYPNPLSAGTDAAINFRFPEAPAGSGGEASVTLYDIKGRKVAEHVLSPSELLCGQGTLRTDRLAPGIYLAACRINGVRLSLKRLTVM